MSELWTAAFVTTFLTGCLLSAMPLLLASVGESINERSGVLNLGIEGMMLVGGFVAYTTALSMDSMWLGLIAGVLGSMTLSFVLVVLNVWFGLNQIVVGIAITLVGSGVTSVLYNQYFSQMNPRVGSSGTMAIPFLSKIPVVGPSLFSQPVIFWACLALVVIVGWFLTHSNWGLSARAAGEKPESLDASGGSVMRTRTQAVFIGGAFAGLGGGYLALVTTGAFTPHMTQGLGYVAIIVTMLTRGRITWIIGVSLVYGITVALGTSLQFTSWNIPTDVVGMLPFTIMMTLLILFARSVYIPPALGAPYRRGAR